MRALTFDELPAAVDLSVSVDEHVTCIDVDPRVRVTYILMKLMAHEGWQLGAVGVPIVDDDDATAIKIHGVESLDMILTAKSAYRNVMVHYCSLPPRFAHLRLTQDYELQQLPFAGYMLTWNFKSEHRLNVR